MKVKVNTSNHLVVQYIFLINLTFKTEHSCITARKMKIRIIRGSGNCFKRYNHSLKANETTCKCSYSSLKF